MTPTCTLKCTLQRLGDFKVFFINALRRRIGGETGIRTLGTLAGSTVFETAPFDHSGTSPRGSRSPNAGAGAVQGPICDSCRLRHKAWKSGAGRLTIGPCSIPEETQMHHLIAPIIALIFAFAGQPFLAQAAPSDKTDALFAALGLPQVLDIMRTEGMAYGDSLADEMIPGGATPRWAAAVSEIYDMEMMTQEVRAAFDEELQGDDIDAMLAFFASEPGRTIVTLEVSARRALLDDAVDQASKENAAIAMHDVTPRYLLIARFVDVNDLVETNVVGALNANYAFYMGMLDGGAMPDTMTADTALMDVWAQEAEIRSSTTAWVFAFCLLAYQPLSDADLQAYIAFSETEAGQDLNNALFVAFDGMFNDVSRALGLASARFIVSQEL